MQPTNKIKYGLFLNPFKSLSDNLHIPFSAQWTGSQGPQGSDPFNRLEIYFQTPDHTSDTDPPSDPDQTSDLDLSTPQTFRARRLLRPRSKDFFYTMDPCRGLRGPTPSIIFVGQADFWAFEGGGMVFPRLELSRAQQ